MWPGPSNGNPATFGRTVIVIDSRPIVSFLILSTAMTPIGDVADSGSSDARLSAGVIGIVWGALPGLSLEPS
jgi:hypothetical protein